MISQIFTQECFKILSLFSLSPGSRLNRKEIKEKVMLNNVPLDKALITLLHSFVLKREGNYYSVNLENDYAKQVIEICRKQYMQLRELPLNVYYLLIDLISSLSLEKDIEVMLFGSYAKLIYTEKSDIDIAILTTAKANKQLMRKIVNRLERIYSKDTELHFFDKRLFLKNKKDPLVREIIRNSIRLL